MAYSVRGSKHWKAKKAKHYKSEACKTEKRIRKGVQKSLTDYANAVEWPT